MVNSLKWENLEDRRKSARLCMLFKIQHELIDIDRQQYLTPNDSRTRGKSRFYPERSKTDTYRQSFFPKTIRALSMFQSILVSLGQSINHDIALYISNYYIIDFTQKGINVSDIKITLLIFKRLFCNYVFFSFLGFCQLNQSIMDTIHFLSEMPLTDRKKETL